MSRHRSTDSTGKPFEEGIIEAVWQMAAISKEFAPLITSGPAGLAGYASGRPQVRPVFAYWPTLVPKELVPARVEVRKAREWTS